MKIPVIDIFAGPGGLGEGFSSYGAFCDNTSLKFSSVLSIEKDRTASRTLTLRNFFHQFPHDDAPAKYYEALRDPTALGDLAEFREWRNAEQVVWNAELGEISDIELHTRIRDRIKNNKDWVLLGGPPCQAYSLVGRSRMTGLGTKKHSKRINKKALQTIEQNKLSTFYADHRHKLYREYLHIVAVHQPAVFVMENVKGILSSKLPVTRKPDHYERVFPQIRKDLSNPWKAIETDPRYADLKLFHTGRKHTYRLHSFTTTVSGTVEELRDSDFLIRCEEHGIPQRRHRVIILGIRDDVKQPPETLVSRPHRTVDDMLCELPPLRSGLSRAEDSAAEWQSALQSCFNPRLLRRLKKYGIHDRISEIINKNGTNYHRGSAFLPCNIPNVLGSKELRRWIVDRHIKGVTQHETRSHMRSDLGRYLFVSVMSEQHGLTPKLCDWPPDLLPDHRNVTADNKNGAITAGFQDRFRAQIGSLPSTTITSHISKDGHYYIHPDPEQCRSLTVREAARLQTFPDNYLFCGNRTQQYHQVGNAVPPYLALQLAQIVADLFQ